MPPFPARRAAVIVLVLAALVAAGVVVAVPRIDESKRRGAEDERLTLVERREAERRRLAADQAPVTGRVHRPAGRSSAAERRRVLVEAVERAVTREARARVARGSLSGRIARTECTTSAGGPRDPRRARGVYDCLAVTRDIPRTKTNAPGRLGHPFRAVVDFRRFTFAFCKTNPPAGERAVPDPRSLPRLARACSR